MMEFSLVFYETNFMEFAKITKSMKSMAYKKHVLQYNMYICVLYPLDTISII